MPSPLRVISLWCLCLLMACSGAETKKEERASAPDCSSSQTQRVLTYCVSPGAADFARQNDAIRVALNAPEGSINPDMFPLPIGDSPVLGPEHAPVTIVIFSDIECALCAQVYTELELLRSQRPEDVRLVFKHFPYTDKHPNALDVARAAQALVPQGKFWEFVRLAFQRHDELGPRQYDAMVREVGADLEAWRAVVDAPSILAHIMRDRALGDSNHVASTPTIFFNGVPVQGEFTVAELLPVVDQQKQIVQAFLGAGVPKEEIYWRLVRAQYQRLPPLPPTPKAGGEDRELIYVPVGKSPSKGASAENALVTIVVFSDFECPYCQQANPALHSTLAKFSGHVRLVFKHFPLPFHKRADNAAGAAQIAHASGKFWELHDLLFANQSALEDADLQRYIEQVGIKGVDVNALMRSDPSVNQAINADMVLGVEAGVSGTPTMFINGIRVMGALTEEELGAFMIEQLELGEKIQSATEKRGEELYEALVTANANASP